MTGLFETACTASPNDRANRQRVVRRFPFGFPSLEVAARRGRG